MEWLSNQSCKSVYADFYFKASILIKKQLLLIEDTVVSDLCDPHKSGQKKPIALFYRKKVLYSKSLGNCEHATMVMLRGARCILLIAATVVCS